ncbi:amino-acid permease inda1 [Pyricularia oryzae 70-15]|uniref:Amino-acid permease inda1 n=3 Tax=Pyricularia oryzae TaxID=318829 RepID=G4MNA3_PYRO7|nr:amino-acid permease inda1 [Pyricularia oryzae 70-15]EHA56226.1 amino-acid permease inda1 [Pyricularia oryzae 70-15]KAI6354081.1 Amino-acid permease inda1 [Pyricularia oryzae]KAI7915429.1 amino-acid permease inda1 [Pyricularia oryzae]KAI7916580.1 amino-acid permease inda1 [Pyricularia oryzae]
MTSKVDMADEKGTVGSGTLPTYGASPDASHQDMAMDGREENFYTRNGLNLESFKCRSYGQGIVELDRSMKKRHLHMIAIGGSIGAGFFVGSGAAFAKGGPGAVFIDFAIIGVMMFNVVYALGELAVMYPVSGGFYTYSVRFIDPSWGFAMGWNYVFQWAVVLPLELTVCGLTLNYWEGTQAVPLWGWILIWWFAIIIINIFGTLGYAEEEFWSSCLKLSAIVIFMIIAFVLVLGGGPKGGKYDSYWGARHWYEPGAFQNGFKGFCAVFVTAAFSFSGTELVGLAAAESANPAKALPGAIKQVFWRITLFYILGLFFVGLLVSSTDDRLLSSNPYADGTSPFVIAAKDAGLVGFDHFMNVIILVSVLSIGVSCVYGGSRTLTALAQQGYAPKVFTYVDKSGRPLASVFVIIACGALAFLNLDAGAEKVFSWLLSLSGLAALFTWGSICLAHIRFRQAWKAQGHTLDEIPFQAALGVTGSWIGLILCVLVLIATFYSALFPYNKPGVGTAESFFQEWLSVPVILFFWACGYIWKREGGLKLEQIDVDTGRREHDWDQINAYKAELAAMPSWKRFVKKIF